MIPELAQSREGLRESRASLASICAELERAREFAQVRTKRSREQLQQLHAALDSHRGRK